MHEIQISGSKTERYQQLMPQLFALIEAENVIASLGNICAALKEAFDWLWIGFYIVQTSEQRLVLNIFQGPVACVHIPYGRGVCGKVWQEKRVIVVENVHTFAGHIACSSRSQSEIVLPIMHSETGEVLAVLDVDAESLAQFDEIDAHYLGQLCEKLAQTIDFAVFQAA